MHRLHWRKNQVIFENLCEFVGSPTYYLLVSKVLDKQSQLMNSPCGDPNKELNHKEENQ